MDLLINGKNMEVPKTAREQIEKKIGTLDRYLSNITDAKVELSREKTRSKEDRYVVEVTLNSQGTLLRGEERSGDIHSAIDAVSDVMNRQIRRHKERFDAVRKRRLSARETLAEGMEEPETVVVRVKKFQTKPMSPEEAIDQMELLGHDFFVFFNKDNEQFSVIYRRRGGNYGLLEPELD